MSKFVWPVPNHPKISSHYGSRIHPVTKQRSFHHGIDIAAGSGVKIHAAKGGIVQQAAFSGTYGNQILINHGNGTKTRYAHLSKYHVKAGDKVKAGQLIGLVGATGRVTGPHLHFELFLKNAWVNPLDYVSPSDTAADYDITGTQGKSDSSTDSTEPIVVHIPQTEKVYTVYDSDKKDKPPDVYRVAYKPYGATVYRNITDRVGNLELKDDADSVCTELTFDALEGFGDYYLGTLPIVCGDTVTVTNTASHVCVFFGQVQSLSGSFRGELSVSCLDLGRLLTTNDIILQCNNVAAKTALTQLSTKLGIQKFSCPNLVSSVYECFKDSASSIAQGILETCTAENGVPYFLRMMGDTLVVRSFAKTTMTAYCRPTDNLPSFDVLAEASGLAFGRSIDDLRNHIVVYSDKDDSVSVQGTAFDAASIARYGRRTALETFSDKDTVSASKKAAVALANRNVVEESLTITTYGSDAVVAGCRLAVSSPKISGEFWVQGVTHELGTPHRMTLNLRRATV